MEPDPRNHESPSNPCFPTTRDHDDTLQAFPPPLCSSQVYVSAKTGLKMSTIYAALDKAAAAHRKRITTAVLNEERLPTHSRSVHTDPIHTAPIKPPHFLLTQFTLTRFTPVEAPQTQHHCSARRSAPPGPHPHARPSTPTPSLCTPFTPLTLSLGDGCRDSQHTSPPLRTVFHPPPPHISRLWRRDPQHI